MVSIHHRHPFPISSLLGLSITALLWFILIIALLVSVSYADEENPGQVLFSLPDEDIQTTLSLSDEEQAWLKENHEVLVGYVDKFPPTLISDEQGHQHGILPEIFELLTAKTGINFRIQLASSWQQMIAHGYEGKTDMIGLVADDKGHQNHVDVTRPFMKTFFYIFGPGAKPPQPEYTLDDLSGKEVGYIQSFQVIETLTKQYPNIHFTGYINQDSLIDALTDKQVDYIISSASLEYRRQKEQEQNYIIYGGVPELEKDLMMAVRVDWPELTSILNKAISTNKEKIKSIIDNWMERDDFFSVKNNAPTFTLEEQLWLEAHPVLRVGLDPQWAPIEFLDHKSKPQGISIGYLKRIENILGVRFEYPQVTSWLNSYQALTDAKIDLLPAVSATEKRLTQVNMTTPYLSMPIGIFSSSNKAYLGNLDALNGKRVVVVEGYAIQDWLAKDHPELELVTSPTLKSALRKVSQGDAYAFIGNLVSTSYYIGQSGLSQIRIVGETHYRNNLGMAVRKDWEILPSILEKAINSIPESQRIAIYNKWISIEYKHSVDYSLLWKIFAGVALVFILSLYWIRRLAKEVSQRKTIETALRQAMHQTEEASLKALKATEVKSDFLTNMSHEIRTPMNAIIGTSHLLKQTSLTPLQHEYLNKMTYSSEALLSIIDDLLDFSRGEAVKVTLDNTIFDLPLLLNKVTYPLESEAQDKNLQVNTAIAPDIPKTLIGDHKKLSQIIRNLMANAIKFTTSGSVSLTVTKLDSSEDSIVLKFTITDTGIGISLKGQEKLFRPFSQEDSSIRRRYGGTGLGLAISQQLALLMGDGVMVDSQLGRGSQFSFTASLQTTESEMPTDNEMQNNEKITAVTGLTGIKVLVVEDDDINQYFESKFLLAFGCEVTMAENGKKALEALDKERFDIVLMDIQMPVMDGYQTTQHIRKNLLWKSLPIIALTAHALTGEREKCLESGMNDHITKPFDPLKLRDKLLEFTSKKNTGGGKNNCCDK